MSTFDDNDDDLVMDPDAEPTAAERARARAFAELVDKVVAGRAPAAMSAEDRPLVETATVIRAAAGNVELPAAKAKALVEQALARSVGGAGAGASAAAIPIQRARRAKAPWIVAGVSSLVAAAAVLLLLLQKPPVREAAPSAPTAETHETWKSRPSDPLVGRISEENSGEAAARIDAIFADRLDGYRERTLARGGR